jgi:acyl-CoA reductase-like NAD-dependent aldehyde dehydrogenase
MMSPIDAADRSDQVTIAEHPHHDLQLPTTKLLIDGDWWDAEHGATFSVVNPATEQPIASVASASASDIDRAVGAARRQFDGGEWSRFSGRERARLLHRLADLIEDDLENLARLEALDIGKPVGDPRNVDVPMAADTFRHFAGRADGIRGTTVQLPDFLGSPRLSYTVREPVGVVGAITPWNAPTMIAAWKIAPALAAGCTVVIKPPEDAPLTTLRIGELALDAGLPPGVLNILPGTGIEAGAALVRHPGVDKVSFTGSPEVGAEIARATGPAFRRTTLELGGKSPQIVFPDADLDAALPAMAVSLFANQGETCAAGTRVLVHHDIRDDVISGLAEHAEAVRVGDPFDPETTMGSLINQRQLERVLGYIESGRAEGADLLVGGTRVGSTGYFVRPTLFAGTNDLRIAQDEIFGPVGTIVGFADRTEAIATANATRYGLAAVIWTRDVSSAHLTARALRVGAVWINGWGPPDPALPWGGVKTSGIGAELGDAGIAGVTNEKVVSVIL